MIEPLAAAWVDVWAALAAERNGLPVEAFRARVRVDPPRKDCSRQGTCTLEIRYRYRVQWLELEQSDLLFIRLGHGQPWLNEAQLRGDRETTRLSRLRHYQGPFAFESRASAEAAFISRFGHPPRGVKWVEPRAKRGPFFETPTLVGDTVDCNTEVANLGTGRVDFETEDWCDVTGELKRPPEAPGKVVRE